MQPNNILNKDEISNQEYRIGNGIYNVNRVFGNGKTIKDIILANITKKKISQLIE